jgi:hypothetical protein
MPNEEITKQLIDQAILTSEVMIKLKAIEQLLKAKNVFSEDELAVETKKVVAEFSEIVETALLANTSPILTTEIKNV